MLHKDNMKKKRAARQKILSNEDAKHRGRIHWNNGYHKRYPDSKENLKLRKQLNNCKPPDDDDLKLKEHRIAVSYRTQKSRFWKKAL
jgi:hypothetical protein